VWAYGPFFTGIDYLKFSRMRGLLMQQVDKIMQQVDVYFNGDGRTLTNLTGHPKVIFPKQLKPSGEFLEPVGQPMIGRLYDESTLLMLASAYQQAMNLTERPPLEKFLADKDKFLAGEVFPDENKLYEE
jgi:Asp-tRNA(Asn)/Glu-tRNA(Gln) amidotransferase A subunit family amidase